MYVIKSHVLQEGAFSDSSFPEAIDMLQSVFEFDAKEFILVSEVGDADGSERVVFIHLESIGNAPVFRQGVIIAQSRDYYRVM